MNFHLRNKLFAFDSSLNTQKRRKKKTLEIIMMYALNAFVVRFFFCIYRCRSFESKTQKLLGTNSMRRKLKWKRKKASNSTKVPKGKSAGNRRNGLKMLLNKNNSGTTNKEIKLSQNIRAQKKGCQCAWRLSPAQPKLHNMENAKVHMERSFTFTVQERVFVCGRESERDERKKMWQGYGYTAYDTHSHSCRHTHRLSWQFKH